MNWEAISAISETIGVFAVVVSLVYLAVQVREQNRESRIAASYEIAAAFRETISTIQDQQRAEITVIAMRDIEQLNDTQRLQFNSIGQAYFRVWEQAHYQHSEGRLEESMWQAMLSQYRDVMSHEGFRTVWMLRKHTFRNEFREFVDTVESTEYRLK